MVHRLDAKGCRTGLGALTGVALALSMVFVNAVAGQHTHTGTAESPASCAVCVSTHQAPVTASPAASTLIPLAATTTPLSLEPEQELRAAVIPSYRTRAPPVSRSL